MATGITRFKSGSRPFFLPATGGVNMGGYVPGYSRASTEEQPVRGPSPIAQQAAGTAYAPIYKPEPKEPVYTEEDYGDENYPNVNLNYTGTEGLTSTSDSGSTAADRLAFDKAKFALEQAAAEDAAARIRAGQQAQLDYIRGQLGAGIPAAITSEIAKQETEGQNYINTQYQNLLSALGARRTAGEDVLTSGYDALRNYLASNVPQAYATAARAVPTTVQSGLEQYLASRGVSGEPSAAEVAAVNAQLAGGATNYNQLLNVLAAQEAAGQQSRLAEERMARQLGGERIGQIYAGATAGLEQEKLAALNELASRISNARLQAEQQRIAREQALQDALATLLGQGYAQLPPAPLQPVSPLTFDQGISELQAALQAIGPSEEVLSRIARGGL